MKKNLITLLLIPALSFSLNAGNTLGAGNTLNTNVGVKQTHWGDGAGTDTVAETGSDTGLMAVDSSTPAFQKGGLKMAVDGSTPAQKGGLKMAVDGSTPAQKGGLKMAVDGSTPAQKGGLMMAVDGATPAFQKQTPSKDGLKIAVDGNGVPNSIGSDQQIQARKVEKIMNSQTEAQSIQALQNMKEQKGDEDYQRAVEKQKETQKTLEKISDGVFNSSEKQSCKTLMCLIGAPFFKECRGIVKDYFRKKPKARIKFLKICPMKNGEDRSGKIFDELKKAGLGGSAENGSDKVFNLMEKSAELTPNKKRLMQDMGNFAEKMVSPCTANGFNEYTTYEAETDEYSHYMSRARNPSRGEHNHHMLSNQWINEGDWEDPHMVQYTRVPSEIPQSCVNMQKINAMYVPPIRTQCNGTNWYRTEDFNRGYYIKNNQKIEINKNCWVEDIQGQERLQRIIKQKQENILKQTVSGKNAEIIRNNPEKMLEAQRRLENITLPPEYQHQIGSRSTGLKVAVDGKGIPNSIGNPVSLKPTGLKMAVDGNGVPNSIGN